MMKPVATVPHLVISTIFILAGMAFMFLSISHKLQDIEGSIYALRQQFADFFNFASDRHRAVEHATTEVSICGEDLTGTAILIDGKYVTTITSAHCNCIGRKLPTPKDYIACPFVDAAFGTECPTTSSAIVIDSSDIPIEVTQGQSVVGTGYASQTGETVYTGTVAKEDTCALVNDLHEDPWSGHAHGFCNSYFLALLDQASGMSGCLVVGAEGVLGVASYTLAIEYGGQPPKGPLPRSRRTVIGKFNTIFRTCLWPNRRRMKKLSDCPNIKSFDRLPTMTVDRATQK
jgi:hypothetical protein